MNYADFASPIRLLAEAAGREILKIYHSGAWSVTAKDDDSPVTHADMAANAILVPGIRAVSNAPVVSEEGHQDAIDPDGRFWLVDPLDGTRDFVAHRDTFVVCVALIEARKPVFGLIHMPVTGETWWAARGAGAHGPTGEPLDLRGKSPSKPLIAAGSRSMPSDRMQLFYDLFGIREIRRMGSAVKFCKVAEGEIDLYPRFGPTSEWDTAAGQIILEEAGGKLIELKSGLPLTYAKPGFLNTGFVASHSDLDIVGELKRSGKI